MAVSLNSVINFNPTGNHQQVTRSNTRASIPKTISFLRGSVRPRQFIEAKSSLLYPLAASSGNIVTETTGEDAKTIEGSFSNDANISDTNSPLLDKKIEPTVETSNDTSIPNQESKTRTSEKKAPLTARERLRAARVLSRYTEAKPPSTPALGSKLLESLRETDKGKKRPSLPEAPTNLLDDSKRGLSKGGWTVDLSSGMDVIVIVFSFVFISTLMFATTYFVWKVGAIHFNEN